MDVIITNNKFVDEYYSQNTSFTVDFCEQSQLLDILIKVRQKIHEGHRLLTHPLSGSIKPNETPFKTVVISGDKSEAPDTLSVQIIGEAVLSAEKFLKNRPIRQYSQRILDDFMLIDFDLIKNAL